MVELIVKSKIKQFINNNDMKISTDTYEAIEKEVEHILKKAITRAKNNDRATVMARDF